MKSVLGILCFWLLAGPGLAYQPLAYQPSHTYVYEAESRSVAAIPELDDQQVSAFSMIYKVLLQIETPQKIYMRLKDVRTARVNDNIPEPYDEDVIIFHHTEAPEFERYLSKQVEITYQNGVVEKFEADQSDPEWSVNIKKAIIALFQVDMAKAGRPVASRFGNEEHSIHPEASLYSVYEDGIMGECQTNYHILSIPSLDHPRTSQDVLNVTKVKNYKNCMDPPKFGYHNFQTQGCPSECSAWEKESSPKDSPPVPGYPPTWNFGRSDYPTGCPYGFQPDHQPIKAYDVVQYNISSASKQPVIDEIQHQHRIVYELNGNELVLLTLQTFNLTHVKQGQEGQSPSKPVTYESLAYELPDADDESTPEEEQLELPYMSIFGEIDQEQLELLVMQKLEDIAQDMITDDPSDSEKSGAKVIQLLDAINVMVLDSLDETTRKLAVHHIQKPSRKQQLMRSIWLETLGLCPTNECAKLSAILVKSKRVTSSQAASLVEAVGKNLESPQLEIIQEYLALLDSPQIKAQRRIRNSLAITVGKLIDQACVDPKLSNSWESEGDDDSETQTPNEPRHRPSGPHSQQPSPRRQPQQPPRQNKRRFSRDVTNSKRKPQQDWQCSRQQLQSLLQQLQQKLQSAKTPGALAIYIEALAHTTAPEALVMLLPYVTGEAPALDQLPDDESDFITTVAIYALHHIADKHPQEVLPIVVEKYFDQSNDYTQRIAAFSVMMNSEPSLVTLQRVLVELSSEINNQVGSYVVSSLNDIANSTVPCQRKLSQKVQSIISQVPDEYDDTGIQYSQAYIADFYDDDRDYGASVKAEWVASNDSQVPRTGYLSLSHIFGPFQDDVLEFGYQAKGIEEMWEKLTQPGGILSRFLSQTGSTVDTKNLHSLLDVVKAKIQLQESDDVIPRATLFYKLFGRTTYLTMDEAYVIDLVEQLINWCKEFDSSSGVSGQYTKIYMPSSLFYVLPNGMGLPTVISHRNPIIFSFSVSQSKASSGDHKESPLNYAFAASTIVHPELHFSSLVMAYFVNPAEDKLYGAAAHRVYELSTPAVLGIAVDLQKETYALSLKPKLPHRVIYHKTTAFTFITEAVLIGTPKAELMDQANEIQTMPETLKFDQKYPSKTWGLAVRVQSRAEDPWADMPFWLSQTAYKEGVVPALVELLKNPELKPRTHQVYLEPEVNEPASQIILTLDYDRDLYLHGAVQPVTETPEEECDEDDLFQSYEEVLGGLYGKQYEMPDAEKTVQDLIRKTQATWSPVLGQESTQVVPASISHSWEVTAVIKGSGAQAKHLAGKFIYSHTLDHRVIWSQFYGHKSSVYQGKPPQQVCASWVVAYPPQPNPFYLEMNAVRSQKANIRGEFGWGYRDCTSENQILINGVMEKTEEQMTSSSNIYLDTPEGEQQLPWFYQQCELDRQDGETLSYACQEAIDHSARFNRVDLEFTARRLNPELHNATHKLDLALKSYWYPNMESNPLVRNEEDTLRVVVESIEQIEDLDLTNIYVFKPSENIEYSKLYTPLYETPSAVESFAELYGDQLFDGEYNAECYVMEDYLRTLDNITIELPDNKCEYILAQDTSPSEAFVILASQIDLKAKTKAISIAAASHTVKLYPPAGGKFRVVIDDTDHHVSPAKSQVVDFEKDSEIIVYAQETVSPGSPNVLTLKYYDLGLEVQYDGKNLILQVPREYKGELVGLCGDFNDEQFQEFSGPNGCVYVEEEDFAASYAIPGQSCPAPPQPKGPAFCPPGVQRPRSRFNAISDEEDDEEDSSSHDRRRPSKQPLADQDTPHAPASRASRRQYENKPETPARQQPAQSHQDQPRRKTPSNIPDEEEEETRQPHSPRQPISEQPGESAQLHLPKPQGPPKCLEQTTIVKPINGKTCFSVQPVYECSDECEQEGLQQLKVGYKCFDKGSVQAQKYAQQVQEHGLVQKLIGEPSDESQLTSSPKKCVPSE